MCFLTDCSCQRSRDTKDTSWYGLADLKVSSGRKHGTLVFVLVFIIADCADVTQAEVSKKNLRINSATFTNNKQFVNACQESVYRYECRRHPKRFVMKLANCFNYIYLWISITFVYRSSVWYLGTEMEYSLHNCVFISV